MFPEDLGNRVVLVVEDEARLRRVAVKMLNRLGLRSNLSDAQKTGRVEHFAATVFELLAEQKL